MNKSNEMLFSPFILFTSQKENDNQYEGLKDQVKRKDANSISKYKYLLYLLSQPNNNANTFLCHLIKLLK